jgi:hypothetical protein
MLRNCKKYNAATTRKKTSYKNIDRIGTMLLYD